MPIGWHISVFRQVAHRQAPATFDHAVSKDLRLAVWQTDENGLLWIDRQIKAGQVIDLGGCGYPCRFTGMAKYIIPEIRTERPEARARWVYDPGDVLLKGWLGKTYLNKDLMNQSSEDEWLVIDAWDLS